MTKILSCLLLLLICNLFDSEVDAFGIHQLPATTRATTERKNVSSTTLSAVSDAAQNARRRELLSRSGPYFKVDRSQGRVEFGSSAKLVTQLDTTPNQDGIAEWLSDGRGLALSIWDEKLMTDLGDSLYRLQTMKLQFVTIQLAPCVDMKMWTQQDANGSPVFMLQSIDYDPNIQLLPGLEVSAETLGIEIEVVGQLQPSKDGKGVVGVIAFATQGKLPGPMLLLPEPVLKLASDTINETVVKFAIDSFKRGATQKYNEFQQG